MRKHYNINWFLLDFIFRYFAITIVLLFFCLTWKWLGNLPPYSNGASSKNLPSYPTPARIILNIYARRQPSLCYYVTVVICLSLQLVVGKLCSGILSDDAVGNGGWSLHFGVFFLHALPSASHANFIVPLSAIFDSRIEIPLATNRNKAAERR